VESSTEAPNGVRLAEIVASLSMASGIGLGQPMENGLRSCVLGMRLGEQAGLDADELRQVFYVTLLRFSGCTASAESSAEVWGGDDIALGRQISALDFSRPAQIFGFLLRNVGRDERITGRTKALSGSLRAVPSMVEAGRAHCEAAQLIADRLGCGSDVVELVGHVFEQWNGRGLPAKLAGDAIPRSVRVATMASDLQVFFDLGGVDAVFAVAKDRRGSSFDPALVDVLVRSGEAMLFGEGDASLWDTALDLEPGRRATLVGDDLYVALRALGEFADLASRFTRGHSRGVADLVRSAAELMTLDRRVATTAYRAALVHDLGVVAISSAVWNKPQRLTDGDWEQVRLHPYYTTRVFSRIAALHPVGQGAGMHHERLDAGGYPNGRDDLPMSARLVGAADAYHAMTEVRPHRPRISEDVAAKELRGIPGLDGDVVAAVLNAAGHDAPRPEVRVPGGLTPREVEVLVLVARGMTNKEVAAELAASAKTVGHHLQHVYQKIGVSTRAAAGLWAMQNDLLAM
jgi:HD-GYP domain-containing protein (c-di-GMP phosphodiesterase class II)/DNA-binding CsgD family transcriptional regulator